jgi:hypothetical protein
MRVLFRAKEKNTDNYIIGYEYYNHIEDEYYITHYISGNNYKVDKSTRSINFESMTDIKGDKIFASLQEDGKGGDILFDMEYEFTLIFDGFKFRLEGLECNTEINEYDKFTNFDSIGIQQ